MNFMNAANVKKSIGLLLQKLKLCALHFSKFR